MPDFTTLRGRTSIYLPISDLCITVAHKGTGDYYQADDVMECHCGLVENTNEKNGIRGSATYNKCDEEDDEIVDPHFFDADYDAAVATGFGKVWGGSFTIIRWCEEQRKRLLFGPSRDVMCDTKGHKCEEEEYDKSTKEIDDIIRSLVDFNGKRCIELGSGVGMFGIYAAALGAHVLLTDVRSVVEEVSDVNISLNEVDEESGNAVECTFWYSRAAGRAKYINGRGAIPFHNMTAFCSVNNKKSSNIDIPPLIGMASTEAINWREPLPEGIRRPTGDEECRTVRRHNIILSSECVWLKELLPPFADTLSELLESGDNEIRGHKRVSSLCTQYQEKEKYDQINMEATSWPTMALICYPVRSKEGVSETFSTRSDFEHAMDIRGVELIVLANLKEPMTHDLGVSETLIMMARKR